MKNFSRAEFLHKMNEHINEHRITEPVNEHRITEPVNEAAFPDWEVSFKAMNLSGVKLHPKNVYKVKARGTGEAIRKAAKLAGVKDDQWIATETNFVKKLA